MVRCMELSGQPTDERSGEYVFSGIAAKLANPVSDVSAAKKVGHKIGPGQLIDRPLEVLFVNSKSALPGEFEKHLQIGILFVPEPVSQFVSAGFGQHLQCGRHKVVKMSTVKQLVATGGDEALMCEALASGAWKAGACKRILGDRFGDLFEETVAQDLKTGSAKRIVKMHDPAFGGGA